MIKRQFLEQSDQNGKKHNISPHLRDGLKSIHDAGIHQACGGCFWKRRVFGGMDSRTWPVVDPKEEAA